MRSLAGLSLLTLVSVSQSATPARRYASEYPTITLDNGTFVGVTDGPVSIFRGIPYAQPPVGDLRLRLPVANAPYNGTFNATAFGAACIQQVASGNKYTGLSANATALLESLSVDPGVADDEDCLTVNVFTPANATKNSKLPVVFWIYGGGFESGYTAMYNGSAIVARSLQLGLPVVYVSVNYRLNALGFPGGVEAREAGATNLGLHDQRLGMRWVQKYISAFGGDPSKVIIWGESAGSDSVSLHLLTNNGDTEGLFRGAFMESGFTHWYVAKNDGQSSFDNFAKSTGCGQYLRSPAVFDCLRKVSTVDYRAAIQASPNIFSFQGLNLAWQPRIDGAFVKESPTKLVLKGSVADVPFITGDCADEGTLFSLSNSNITTDDGLRQYLAQFFPSPTNFAQIDSILKAYPNDPALGSPFGTGSEIIIAPQFKRISAILGDFEFQALRRFFLSERPGHSTAFVFLSKRLTSTPIPALGAYHGSEVLENMYGPGDLTDALVNFATHLDPNGPTLIEWPAYKVDSPKLFTFLDGNVTQAITDDTYRAEGMKVIRQILVTDSV